MCNQELTEMMEVSKLQRKRIRVRGIVQGVGFRPYIFNLAKEYGLSGWVTNDSIGVLIEVEGEKEKLETFFKDISEKAPPLARIDSVESHLIPEEGDKDFVIRITDRDHKVQTLISPDMSICPDCLEELFDPNDRRYLYPFINCTNCGPRFTIITEMPYDRPFTTMEEFIMCPDCQEEYDNPTNRRFHAQPNACPVCGPKVLLVNNVGLEISISPQKIRLQDGNMAKLTPPWAYPIIKLRDYLTNGKICGVKGLGGYHLICDAKNESVIKTLRHRKNRPDKPLAVMMPDIQTIKKYCQVSVEEKELLTSPSRPIVLLKWLNKGNDGLVPEIAPMENRLGVMLPYTPIHYMLFDERLEVLVVTSGNMSGEPIIYDDKEAISRLGSIVDYFLIHNRKIVRPCDDSVQRVDYEPIFLRRSRGYAPVPIKVAGISQEILGCGGELKNTFALSRNQMVFLSQYIGDLKTHGSFSCYRRMINEMMNLLEVNPQIIAYDLHPEYLSSRYARETYQETKKLIGTQHHHSHIASCMAEHNLTEKVIGVAYDGTGYGTDGKIWGGEVLICTPGSFERFAHLKYLPLPGGEQAILEPWRVAACYLDMAVHDKKWIYELPLWQSSYLSQWKILKEVMMHGRQFPESSSMGRLFDAVAAICGIRGKVSFEGQAAIGLEEIAADTLPVDDEVYPYQLKNVKDSLYQMDPLPMITRIAEDIKKGIGPEKVAQVFHNTIINLTCKLVLMAREKYKLEKVVLSGGVFQNRLLSMGLVERLNKQGFQVYQHSKVPPNDGGLALGQIFIAAHQSESFR